MYRVNYRPPEALPSHQRDFPPRPPSERIQQRREPAGRDGSGRLALMVALYLLALYLGLAGLVRFTPGTEPNVVTAEIKAGR
jgi:hypothetical protein